MRMRRQFDDRANKMRMDLLSMKKTAATNKPGGGNNSGADPAKSDEDFWLEFVLVNTSYKPNQH